MKSSSAALALAALVSQVSAFPQFAEELEKRQDANEWMAPGPGDVRSPCPGTNTLANHGYINRNGKGVTMQAYQQAFLDAFGFDLAVTAPGAQNAINQCSQLTGGDCSTTGFNLDMLNTPHEIEHDGSLTRHDAEQTDGQDDNHDFAMDVWQTSLDLFGSCTTHVNTDLASYVRLNRNSQQQAADVPGWFQLNAGGQEAEHSFTLTSMNDPAVNGDLSNPQARLDWISYWYENERLPTALGWTKPAISVDNTNAVAAAVGNSPGVAPNCAAGPSKTPSGPGSYPTMVPYGNGTSTGSGSGSGPDKSSSAKSSACDVATSIVGPAPSAPNAYKTVLPAASWASYESEVKVYVTKVEYVASSVLAHAGYTATGAAAPQGAASVAATAAAVPTVTVAPAASASVAAASASVAAAGSSAAAVGSSMASAYLATATAGAASPSSTSYTGAASRMGMEAVVAGGAVIAGLAAFL